MGSSHSVPASSTASIGLSPSRAAASLTHCKAGIHLSVYSLPLLSDSYPEQSGVTLSYVFFEILHQTFVFMPQGFFFNELLLFVFLHVSDVFFHEFSPGQSGFHIHSFPLSD